MKAVQTTFPGIDLPAPKPKSKAAPSLRDLPQSLREIADVIGLAGALALSGHLGGTRITVPTVGRLWTDHPLCAAIHYDEVLKLAEIYGGTSIYVPKADGAARELRNVEIRELRRRGVAVANLARRFRLSDRQVLTILGETHV